VSPSRYPTKTGTMTGVEILLGSGSVIFYLIGC
jgi:hypothetical protein